MHEQTNTAEEKLSSKKDVGEVNENINAEQVKLEESGSETRETKSEQVDFSQMYDMLTERDAKIKTLQSEITDLKKTNTELLLKVNASATPTDAIKTPYQRFVDAMENR